MPRTNAVENGGGSAGVEQIQSLRRIADLEQDVVNWRKRYRILEQERDALRFENEQLKAEKAGGFKEAAEFNGLYRFNDFMVAVIQQLGGKSKNWQTHFAEHADPSHPERVLGLIQSWRKRSESGPTVPSTYFKMVATLPRPEGERARGGWTEHDYARLRDLLNQDPRPQNKEIARTLSTEFGRILTTNAIKGAIHRLQSR